ncbi:MAG: DUF4381 domain-containing protein [Pseudohaliea sp.]
MNGRFEGLSLPQLTERLHDVVMPAPVSMAPETVGWLILGGWALAVVAVLTTHALLRWRRNRYRREAEAALARIERQLEADPDALAAVGTLLKRTAMTAYAREQVASLHGDAWAAFLRQTAPGDRRVSDAAEVVAVVAYRRVDDPAAVIAAARRWIRVHDA